MFKFGAFLYSTLVFMPILLAQTPPDPTVSVIKVGNEEMQFPTKGNPTVCQGSVSDRKPISVKIVIPPGKAIKAQLGGRFAGELRVRFVNNIRSRKDPGLMGDATNFRNDLSSYKNKTTEPKTIFCVVRNIETKVPQIMAEFTLTFTEES